MRFKNLKISERKELLMRNRETVQLITSGQMKELAAAVLEGIPVNLSSNRAQYLIGCKRKLASDIKNVLVGTVQDVNAFFADWASFYSEIFGLELGFSNLRVPERRKGFDRLIVVAEGMTPNRLYDKCFEFFPCWRYTDNLNVIASDRKADKRYAVWVRERQEADEELKNKSANQLKDEGIPAITLEERLLYELKFFKETGKYLDERNVTLCAGSRSPDGGVPRVGWYPGNGGMNVGWCVSGIRGDNIRARVAVS